MQREGQGPGSCAFPAASSYTSLSLRSFANLRSRVCSVILRWPVSTWQRLLVAQAPVPQISKAQQEANQQALNSAARNASKTTI